MKITMMLLKAYRRKSMIPTKEQEQKFLGMVRIEKCSQNELGAAFKKWSGLPVGKDSVDEYGVS